MIKCPLTWDDVSCDGQTSTEPRGHLTNASIARSEPGCHHVRRAEPGVACRAGRPGRTRAAPRGRRADRRAGALDRHAGGAERRDQGDDDDRGDAGRRGQHRRHGRDARRRHRRAVRGAGTLHAGHVPALVQLRGRAVVGRRHPGAADPGVGGRRRAGAGRGRHRRPGLGRSARCTGSPSRHPMASFVKRRRCGCGGTRPSSRRSGCRS